MNPLAFLVIGLVDQLIATLWGKILFGEQILPKSPCCKISEKS